MKKEDIDIKKKVSPLVDSLPLHLKDPANYNKIQKLILESLSGGHSHGGVVEWAGCIKCQKKFSERGGVLRKLGFKSPAQYMAWKKIHEEIKVRFPLVDWNKIKI